MATEEQKKANQLRLANMTIFGLAAGLWDFLGETSYALTPKMGAAVLEIMEKEMGLEIVGEKPEDVLTEIARIFVDEFGFASDIEVVKEGDALQMKVHSCLARKLTDQLQAAGVESPFTCPIMNAAQAAMKRLNMKARSHVDKWAEEKGSIITFEVIE